VSGVKKPEKRGLPKKYLTFYIAGISILDADERRPACRMAGRLSTPLSSGLNISK